MMTFSKIVNLCEKHGFLHRIARSNTNRELYKVGSTGALLQENLRNEWFSNIVINKDISTFPSLNGFSETFDFAKRMCMETAPFAITRFSENKTIHQKSDAIKFSKYFKDEIILECFMFVTPSNATQFFHQLQRERRMWWRKFSASPGRYSLTDMKNGESQNVDILAKYDWGDQLVETLILSKDCHGLSLNQLQVREGKKTVQAQCVISKISLSTMLLNTLCDAYDEPLFQDDVRPMLRLHRKLAPYKISFSIPSGQKAVVDELKDLALYLCRQLRKNHISCLLLPSSHKNTLEQQWRQYDQMGVPYNVILNENTLKTGILLLRSRDTTLKEQVHITNLSTYVDQLFKNY